MELIAWAEENDRQLQLIVDTILHEHNIARVTEKEPEAGHKVHKIRLNAEIPERPRAPRPNRSSMLDTPSTEHSVPVGVRSASVKLREISAPISNCVNRTFMRDAAQRMLGRSQMTMDSIKRIKRVARSLQTFFPGLQDFRGYLEHVYRVTIPTPYEANYLGFGLLNLRDGPILDIGANRGQSIDAFRNILKDREIVSFEPNAVRFGVLNKLYSGSRNLRILPYALSDTRGEAILYAPKYRGWIFDGLASMNRQSAMSWLCHETMAWFDPHHLSCVELKIESLTLDDLELAPAAIKIDTEGHELFVVRGALTTIERHKPVILLERPEQEIFKLLEPLGYLPLKFDGQAFSVSDAPGADTYFAMPYHLQSS